MITSLEKLGTHAGLSKEHARRCLDYLGRTQNATLERTHQYTMISVMNWATYQQVGEDTQHAEHHADHHSNSDSATRETPQRTRRATTPSKEVKNLNKKYTSDSNELDGASAMNPPKPTSRGIDPAIRAWFDGECWPLYPRREVKATGAQSGGRKRHDARKAGVLPGALEVVVACICTAKERSWPARDPDAGHLVQPGPGGG